MEGSDMTHIPTPAEQAYMSLTNGKKPNEIDIEQLHFILEWLAIEKEVYRNANKAS